MTFSFPLIGSTQADHMNQALSWREHQHVQMLTDESQSLKSMFSVILTQVLRNQSTVPFEIHHRYKINASDQAVALRFAGVKRIIDQLLYPQFI